MKKDTNKKILSFEVEDTGVGIEQDNLHKLFKAFGKLNDKAGLNKHGVGLGLMISKDIIESLQGQIRIESQVGVGTTFKFDMVVGVIDNPKREKSREMNRDLDKRFTGIMSPSCNEMPINN